MSKTVTLKHAIHALPERYEFFYDGQAVAYDGLLTLPVDDVNHIRAAFFRGYTLTTDGERLVTFDDLDNYIERQTAESAEGNSNDKSSDSRGFSTDKNRIRQSKSNRRKKVSK